MSDEADLDPLIAYDDDPETDRVHQPYTAFNQGYDAADQGTPASLNPYPEGSREREWWDEGHDFVAGEHEGGFSHTQLRAITEPVFVENGLPADTTGVIACIRCRKIVQHDEHGNLYCECHDERPSS